MSNSVKQLEQLEYVSIRRNLDKELTREEVNKDIGINTKTIINSRYAKKDKDGKPIEDWYDISKRVAKDIARVEKEDDRSYVENQFFNVISKREFIPATPCIANAGKENNAGYAACFILPIEDSLEDIMEHSKVAAKIHKAGGGTGMSYEKLRPEGAIIGDNAGKSSGAVSFMNIINTVTDIVKQGNLRRGANMGILTVWHPEILKFIHAKNDQTSLTNFNISVTITDDFMEVLSKSDWYQTKFNNKDWDKPVKDPITGNDYVIFYDENDKLLSFINKADYENRKHLIKNAVKPPKHGMVYSPDVWHRICGSAHSTAEPGLIYIDTINKFNYIKNTKGLILSTNPCGEQAMISWNSCNLGSIDISKLVKLMDDTSNEIYTFDYEKFKYIINVSVRFLDNVIDASPWIIPKIEETVKDTRPIGLGIMGFADLLLKLKIKYGSDECYVLTENIMRCFETHCWKSSLELGKEKGCFPDFEANKDLYKKFFSSKMHLDDLINNNDSSHYDKMDLTPRNYQTNCVAPTGSISLIAECSSGIEPNFAWAYNRKDSIGERGYIHPLVAKYFGITYDKNDSKSIYDASRVFLEKIENEPLPEWFIDAHDLSAEDHVRVLASFQRYIDNSISKCVTKDTILLTDEGMVNIDQLSDFREEDQFTNLDIKVKTSKGDDLAKSFYYGGIKTTVKIELVGGYKIEGTPNHRIHILGSTGSIEFKRLDEITTKDIPVLYTNQNKFGLSKKDLPRLGKDISKENNPKANFSSITIPSNMSSKLAHFLGVLIADGAILTNSINISKSDNVLLEELGSDIKELFKLNYMISKDQRNSCYRLVVNSKVLVHWLIFDLGLKKGSRNKKIPNCIMLASKEEIIDFLNGLFWDAYITSGISKFGLCMSTERLLKQVQLIFLNLGIVSSLNKHSSDAAYALTVSGNFLDVFASTFKFDQAYKQNLLENRNKNKTQENRSYFSLLPIKVTQEIKALIDNNKISLRARVGKIDNNFQDYNRIKNTLNHDRRINRADAVDLYSSFKDSIVKNSYLDNFFSSYNKDLIYTEIKNISIGQSEVFDISVPKSEEFIGNGFCNHNTTNAPHDATIEDVKYIYKLAYDLGVKAVSYYRDGSRDGQVLTSVKKESKEKDISKENRPEEIQLQSPPSISNQSEKARQTERDSIKQAIDDSKYTNRKNEAIAIDEGKIQEARMAKEKEITQIQNQQLASKINRPKTLNGKTWRIKIDELNIYITVNHDFNKVIEVFINGGVISETVGLLVSLMLRRGFETKEVIKTLRKIKGSHTIWFNQTCCTSPEQLIAECITIMQDELDQCNLVKKNIKQSLDEVEKLCQEGLANERRDLDIKLNKLKQNTSLLGIEVDSLSGVASLNEASDVSDDNIGIKELPNGQIMFNGEIWSPSPSTKEKRTDVLTDEEIVLASQLIPKSSKRCPECSGSDIVTSGKCDTCRSCGWSKCK